MRILRKLLMFFGLFFVAAGAISSLVSELIGLVIFSGSQNLLISSMGVFIFWLSLERVHPEGYKFFLIFILLSSSFFASTSSLFIRCKSLFSLLYLAPFDLLVFP